MAGAALSDAYGGRRSGRGGRARAGWAACVPAAPVAFAAYAAILAFMLAPVRRAPAAGDLAASLRGWPAFEGAVEAAREKAGAA